MQGLPDFEDALDINWCEFTSTLPDGKIIYKNAFATNFKISKENIKEIVANGRARWKVENENNNVLKTKGYHLTHNFGHGKKYLFSLLMQCAQWPPTKLLMNWFAKIRILCA